MFEPRDSGWPSITWKMEASEPSFDNQGGLLHCPASASLHAGPNLILFDNEPAGATYQALLDFGRKHCHAFALVWRDQLDFRPSALDLASRLEPWLCLERSSQEWPGTRLLDSWAQVRWYTITDASISAIRNQGGLYHWRAPDFPEDLAFYRHDGRGWLGSIAHERQGWLDLETFDPDLVGDTLERLVAHGVCLAR